VVAESLELVDQASGSPLGVDALVVEVGAEVLEGGGGV